MEKERSKIMKSSGVVGEKLQSSWSDIPVELASLILSHMPYKDHVAFRATCKSWNSVIAFHGQHRSPLLLLLQGDQYRLFNPIYSTYRMPIQQPPTLKILCSNFGWLLMGASLASDPSIFFYNLFTNVRIDLPNLPPNLLHNTKFSFSSSPTSSDCFVVGVTVIYIYAHVGVIKLGENDWTVVDEIDFTTFVKPFLMSECNPVLHNGQCFCLDIDGKVVMFDPNDPKATWRICGKSFSRKSRTRRAFMVESDGELLAVAVNGEEGRICVYKLHSSKMEWISVSDLGNKILYLSYNGSWADTTSFKGMGNKIYFPKFQGNSLVFYSLDTRNYHSYGDEFWSKNAYNLSESVYSTWIKPMF